MNRPTPRELFDRHHLAVFRYFRRLVGDRQTAEDLTQEVFLRVVRGSETYRDKERETGWIFTIARNLFRDHRRNAVRRPRPASLDAAPAGTYALVVESPEGAYLAASELALQEGSNPPVALAIKAGDDSGSGQVPPPPTPQEKVWKKWVFVGLVGLSAAATVKFVADEEDKGSPF